MAIWNEREMGSGGFSADGARVIALRHWLLWLPPATTEAASVSQSKINKHFLQTKIGELSLFFKKSMVNCWRELWNHDDDVWCFPTQPVWCFFLEPFMALFPIPQRNWNGESKPWPSIWVLIIQLAKKPLFGKFHSTENDNGGFQRDLHQVRNIGPQLPSLQMFFLLWVTRVSFWAIFSWVMQCRASCVSNSQTVAGWSTSLLSLVSEPGPKNLTYQNCLEIVDTRWIWTVSCSLGSLVMHVFQKELQRCPAAFV